MTPADLEKQKVFDIKRKRAFSELIRTDGWKFLTEMINEKLGENGKRLLEPLASDKLNAVEAQEHMKGTMYGIAWVRDLPGITISVTDHAYNDTPAGEE